MSQQDYVLGAIMFAAGVGVPVLAALNAQLGRSLQSPWMAAVVLFAVALVAAVAVLSVTGGVRSIAVITTQPRHLFLGGLLVAFYVLSVTAIAPHFGLFGAIQRSMTMPRMLGLAAMAAGVIMTQRY